MKIDSLGGVVAIAATVGTATFFVGSLQSRVASLESDKFFSQRREEFREALREEAVRNPGQGVPIGTVHAFYGTKAPEGFLLCQGQQVSTNNYPNLAIQLDSSGLLERVEGSGDQFKIPDLQGMFLRGLDPQGVRDRDRSDRSVGSEQGFAVLQHTHDRFLKKPENSNWIERALIDVDRDPATKQTLSKGAAKNYTDGGHRNTMVGGTGKIQNLNTEQISTTESRPVNVAVNWIIKY